MRRPTTAPRHGEAVHNLTSAMYPPQPLHWQILTFLAFAVPFCVCLYKFDLNVAFGVFLMTYFGVSIIGSIRAAQITRRFRVNEAEFLRTMQQQLRANPQPTQDQNAALHLYLSLLDRDFTENDYELLSTLDEVTEKHGASQEQIRGLESESFGDCLKAKRGIASSTDSLEQNTAATYDTADEPLPLEVPSTCLKCAICLENFTPKDSVKCLPCQHVYHDGCIDQWLSRKSNCPVCKRDTFS